MLPQSTISSVAENILNADENRRSEVEGKKIALMQMQRLAGSRTWKTGNTLVIEYCHLILIFIVKIEDL